MKNLPVQYKRISAFFKDCVIPKSGFFSFVLLSIHALYMILFIACKVPAFEISPMNILFFLFSFIPLLFFSLFIDSLMPFRPVRNIIAFLIIFFFLGLNAYHLSVQAPVDFRLLIDNFALAGSLESLNVIISVFNPWTLAASAVILLICILPEYKNKVISGAAQKSPLLPKLFFSGILWAVCVIIPFSVRDEFTGFAESAVFSFFTQQHSAARTGYPYLKNSIISSGIRGNIPDNKSGKPNVFLIMIESFNANFVETKDISGGEYTPFFNSLINKGLYIDRFYGNSMQTCKGQEAAFFSIIPSINGKLFVDFPDLKIHGFPHILSQNGYSTIFFQAYHDLKFDNTFSAMKRAGFSTIETFAHFQKKEDRKNIWGWGVEDGTFYERFFEILDAEHGKSPSSPVFAALATIGTHIPCDGMPSDKIIKIKEPKNIRDRYINALALSDKQLKIFFNELAKRGYLKNSIIIITSDHSFPMKEHGIYNNEICYYDETFRIPFLMLWDGVISPKKISGRPYSQIDIGPTILDCAGITKVQNTFLGRSVLADNSVLPVYLIQPYNGRFLEAVHYPYKYILHEKTKREEAYNLNTDPAESLNIIADIPAESIEKMRKSINMIHSNQSLIERNRIMPGE